MAHLDALLPGTGGRSHPRLAAEDEAVDDRARTGSRGVVEALVPRYRERAAGLFGLPEGEDLRVSLVRNQPWTGYNWYDGGYRSRVDINLDLPLRLPAHLVTAHETYPGHHLEHALKERILVEELGRLEASVLLINTPECLISEGLANVGKGIAVPPAEGADLLVELRRSPASRSRPIPGPCERPPARGPSPSPRDPRGVAGQRRADAPR